MWLKWQCKHGLENTLHTTHQVPEQQWSLTLRFRGFGCKVLFDYLFLVFVLAYMLMTFCNNIGNVLKQYCKLLTRMKATKLSLLPVCLVKRMRAKKTGENSGIARHLRARGCRCYPAHFSTERLSPEQSDSSCQTADVRASALIRRRLPSVKPSGPWHPLAAASLWKTFFGVYFV